MPHTGRLPARRKGKSPFSKSKKIKNFRDRGGNVEKNAFLTGYKFQNLRNVKIFSKVHLHEDSSFNTHSPSNRFIIIEKIKLKNTTTLLHFNNESIGKKFDF